MANGQELRAWHLLSAIDSLFYPLIRFFILTWYLFRRRSGPFFGESGSAENGDAISLQRRSHSLSHPLIVYHDIEHGLVT